ncbi:MAG: streptogrisin [Hydrocarboniphaga sp.]|uniref:S1 family peptidase n=1 Tax=Hydrocarboniphaga sp. TaxID=2033016 RepID=UPI002630BE70|nr:S1 family peptidase [Hydrocarboniphaga sp.]MDB5971725.1 streptogrisin [Hydrocarboniphaga sp.]
MHRSTMSNHRSISASWPSLIFFLAVQATSSVASASESNLASAVARDLRISESAADMRLAAEQASMTKLYPRLRNELGDTYAGAWFDSSSAKLVVATTSPKTIDKIKSAGAEPRLVRHSYRELEIGVSKLNLVAAGLPKEQFDTIWEWGIDEPNNSVYLTIPAGNASAAENARNLVVAAGLNSRIVAIVETTADRPVLLYDVRGGDEIHNLTDGLLCSVGFSVTGGFVTAGHCTGGTTGDSISGYNGVSQGTVTGSRFPGPDDALVQVNSSWTPQPCVGSVSDRSCSASGNVTILGSQEAAIGATVCRYGRTTGGPHCGTVQSKNVTVNYSSGQTVTGMTKASACSEPGDSGGPFIWDTQAQGVLSGGSTKTCADSDDYSYFYPISSTLSQYNVSLIMGPGASLGVPQVTEASLLSCNGKYRLGWTSVSGANSYEVWQSLGTSYPYYLSKTVTGVSTTVTASSSTVSSNFKVRACTSTYCGNFGDPVALVYYSGCP